MASHSATKSRPKVLQQNHTDSDTSEVSGGASLDAWEQPISAESDMNRRLIACIMTTLLAAPLTASAAEITLFEGPNFQGRSMTFHGEASNLDPLGFNDHASSAIVREGIWEGCADAHFRGPCAQLGPGQYPQLETSWL